MKISIRLTLFSIAITTIAIFFCCAVLLITTADNHIENTINNGIAELKMLSNSFYAEMNVVASDNSMSETAKNSLVLYVFRKYTSASVSGAHYILTNGSEAMYNDCPIDPRPSLPDLKKKLEEIKNSCTSPGESDLWPAAIMELTGHKYLAVGHYDNALGDRLSFEHEIYLVRDITNVYDGITRLAVWFACIALITVLLCGFMMVMLIRRTLRPLAALGDNVAAFAAGRYENRIQVSGEDEISALGTSFNQMADAITLHMKALGDTAQQRKLLLSALTHELKTPMTAIIGYSEALQKIRLSQEQREASIAYINGECRRLERLSQKMMQLVTLQDGVALNMKRQPVSVLYNAVRETLMAIAKKESIELVLQAKGNPFFEMDVDMMASVLINLFDNGRKALARHIFIIADETGIVIRDDGSGIPEDEIEKITQPFYMVDKSYSHSIGGSGLGLALCDLMVKAHGAHLDIESQEGRGTSVGIVFHSIRNFVPMGSKPPGGCA